MKDDKTNLKRGFILASVMLGMFLSAIEATIVATAMPSIVSDLGGFSLYSWVFSAYLLTSASTIIIFGRLADIFGRRPIYTIGTIVFLIGSILAALSTSMVILIIARIIQGIGAGALMPMSMTIVGDIYNREERAKVQGYLSSVWGISAIFGPLLGGFFVKYLNWRYVFWMNIPLGILSMVGILIFLRENISKKDEKIDYTGSILIIVIVSLLMYIFVEGGVSIDWTSMFMFGLITLLIVIFSFFIWYEKRQSNPTIPFSIWSSRLIQIANLTALTTGMIMIGIASYLPTFVQGVLGQSAIVAGFTLTTMSIGWPLAATISGRVMLKIESKIVSVIGGVFLIIGAIPFLLLTDTSSPIIAGIGSFFIGIGMGMTSTAFIVTIQSSVEWEIRGTATAIFTFMRSIGSALGVALLGGLLNNQIKQKIDEEQLGDSLSIDSINILLNEGTDHTFTEQMIHTLKQGLTEGLSIVYISIFIIAIVTCIIILFLPKVENE